MSTSFGLHFGSTAACVAVSREGKTDVIANEAGDRTTPAIVGFTDHDQTVGLAAKQGLIRNAANTVCDVKQLLGKRFDAPGVQDIVSASPVKVLDKNGSPVYEVEYKERTKTFTPNHIAGAVFKNLKDTAESHGGLADSHDAVVSVPVHYDAEQQRALVDAANQGGFVVLRVITEPCAALLAYDVAQMDTAHTGIALVFRLGGSSISASVVRVVAGMYHIMASTTQHNMGGNALDQILLNHFAEDFNRQWKCECRDKPRSVTKLRSASQTCRHILSTMSTGHCHIDSLYDGIDYNATLSRSRFEALINGLLQKCLEPVGEVLSQANLTRDNIDKVIVSGGCGRMPSLQQLLKDTFPSAEVLCSIPPDEVIALGAAKQAALLAETPAEEARINAENNRLPCLTSSILLQLPSEGDAAPQYHPVLPKGTPIPIRRQHRLRLAAQQTSVCLTLCQEGEPQPTPLAKLVLRSLPEGSQVEMVLHVRIDGTLHVTCTEPTSNTSTSVTLETDTKPHSDAS